MNGWLGKVVIYVENPDKTDNPAFFAKPDMTERQAQGLSDVIDYAVNSKETQADSLYGSKNKGIKKGYSHSKMLGSYDPSTTELFPSI